MAAVRCRLCETWLYVNPCLACAGSRTLSPALAVELKLLNLDEPALHEGHEGLRAEALAIVMRRHGLKPDQASIDFALLTAFAWRTSRDER